MMMMTTLKYYNYTLSREFNSSIVSIETVCSDDWLLSCLEGDVVASLSTDGGLPISVLYKLASISRICCSDNATPGLATSSSFVKHNEMIAHTPPPVSYTHLTLPTICSV